MAKARRRTSPTSPSSSKARRGRTRKHILGRRTKKRISASSVENQVTGRGIAELT